jgi:hypothetical protein
LGFQLSEPDTWKYSLVRANGRELKNYIQIAQRKKIEFPFIVFDKKSLGYASTRFI